MDTRDYNRQAWDRQVEQQNRWAIPVSADQVAAARAGQWDIFLTPTTPGPLALAAFSYTFDRAGNRLTTDGSGNGVHNGHIDYSYDNLHRLTSATYSQGDEQFTYDLLGNRDGDGTGGQYGYVDSRPSGAQIAYSDNNPANEYSAIDSVALVYDDAGNLIADENGLSYEYDFENRLALLYDDVNDNHVYDPNVDTPIAEFAYDALGRRVITVDHTANPAVTTLCYYDDQNVLAEFDGGSGTLNRYYVNGPTYVDERVLVYDVATAAEYYYLLKELYTVAGLADADGRIVELYDYDAYGTVRVHQPLAPQADGDYDDDGDVDLVDFIAFQVCFVGGGTGCDVFDFDDDQQNEDIDDYLTFVLLFGGPEIGAPYATQIVSRSDLNPYFFTGRRLDQLAAGGPGMYHYRRRAYDPVHGRFLQRDPAGYVDGMNLYEYGRSRPPTLTDPLGTQSQQAPSAKQFARAALSTIHQMHVGYMYYEAGNGWMTGLRYLIWDKLNAALWYWDDYRWGPDPAAEAEWHPLWNIMYLDPKNTPYTVFHEAIHAYNDWVDQHEDCRTDEGLAYAATGMAEFLEVFQDVETELRQFGKGQQQRALALSRLSGHWRRAWTFVDRVGWPGEACGKPFNITDADVRLVNSYLGFKVRCQDLAALYNEQQLAKNSCIEFFCVPSAKSTKGPSWSAICPMKAISAPFK